MRKKLIFSIATLYLGGIFFLTQTGYALEIEQALRRAFPEAEYFERKRIILSLQEREKVRELTQVREVSPSFNYYQAVRNGKPLGYGVVKRARGKLRSFTFLVAVDMEGKVLSVEVLAYREVYGREIKQKRFLAQFRGKTVESPLALNSDIQAITGATISSRALAEGVKEALAYLSLLEGNEADRP